MRLWATVQVQKRDYLKLPSVIYGKLETSCSAEGVSETNGQVPFGVWKVARSQGRFSLGQELPVARMQDKSAAA